MYKFMLIFRHPQNPESFENLYQDLLALVERMPDIKRRQVIHVVGSPLGQSPYFRILEVYFNDRATLEASMRSPAGQEAGAEINKFPQGSFEMVFAEVYEEEGGHTINAPSTDTGE